MPKIKTERTVAKQARLDYGIEILKAMNDNDDLPMPNVYRLAKVMQEYWDRAGYIDDLKERGWTWAPDPDYWRQHLSEIRQEMRKQKRWYFEFVREQGDFKGEWAFVSKADYQKTLERNHADIATRVETHNEKLEDGQRRWVLHLPLIDNVPLLTER